MHKTMLNPTLWRSCRALANERRLRLLRAVYLSGSISVGDVAQACKLPLSIASVYLRQLNARGFLKAVRCSSRVYYTVAADPQVRYAKELISAVCPAIERCTTTVAFRPVLKALTICTCPRRNNLIRCIARHAGIVRGELRAETGMSEMALFRQLDKLSRRGVVVEKNGGYYSVLPADRLAQQLIALVNSTD